MGAPGASIAADPRIASRWIVVAALLFSTGGAAIKATTLSSWQVAGLRSGIAALVLGIYYVRTRPEALSTGLPRPRVLIVGAAYATTLVLYVTAIMLTSAGHAIFLQSTAPFYLLIFAPFILKEPATRTDLGLVALFGLGAALLLWGRVDQVATVPNPTLGNTLAALSGVTWAITVGGLRYLGRVGDSPIVATIWGNALAALVALPWLFPLSATTQDWLVVSYLGVFQIGFAYISLVRGVRGVTAFRASTLLLLEPVLNPLWAWWIHGERLPALGLVGAAVIVLATGLQSIPGIRKSPSK